MRRRASSPSSRYAWLASPAAESAHYGAPRAERIRHTVRLMAAEAVVKPYVRSQENDANDAEGTCEPIMRPNMRVAPQKSVDQ